MIPLQNIYNKVLRDYEGVCTYDTLKNINSHLNLSYLSTWKNGKLNFFVFASQDNDFADDDIIIKCGIKNVRINNTIFDEHNSNNNSTSKLESSPIKFQNSDGMRLVDMDDILVDNSSKELNPQISQEKDIAINNNEDSDDGFYENENPSNSLKVEYNVINICKYWLEGNCTIGKKCKAPHNLNNKLNKQFFEDVGLERYTESERLLLIRNSLPSVCVQHLTVIDREHCQSCCYIHICENYVCGECHKNDENCVRGHDFQTNFNKNILSVYQLQNESSDFLRHLILVSDVRVNTREIGVPSSDTGLSSFNKVSTEDKEKILDAVYDLYKHIVKVYDSKCKIGKLRREKICVFDQFCDITAFFDAHRNLFVLFKYGDKDDEWIIQCRVTDVELLTPGTHLNEKELEEKILTDIPCKYWLAGHCPNNDNCSGKHNLSSQIINKKLEWFDFDEKEKINLLRCSYPTVCIYHNSTEKCANGYKCINMHVCSNFIRDDCYNINGCPYGHSLKEEHTVRILNLFGYEQHLDNERLLKSLILVRGNTESEKIRKQNVLRIIMYVLNEFDGVCSINHLYDYNMLKVDKNILAVKHYFRDYENLTKFCKLPRDSERWILRVKLNLSIPLCIDFLKKECDGNCFRYHLCHSWISQPDNSSCSNNANSCPYSHDISTEHNRKITQQLSIPNEHLSSFIPKLIRSSLPGVCTNYNSRQGCSNLVKCKKLHICIRYVKSIKDSCTKEHCSYGHDFFTERNKYILEQLDFQNCTEAELRCLSISEHIFSKDEACQTFGVAETSMQKREDPNDQLSASLTPHPGLYDDDAIDEICVDFLMDNCNIGSRCKKNHLSNMTYLWQLKIHNSWIALSLSTENELIEKNFCNPSIVQFSLVVSIIVIISLNYNFYSISEYDAKVIST